MITNTRRTYDPDLLKKSQKMYYLLVIDHKALGVCTSLEIAQACAKCYAEKYNAKEIDQDDVYIFEDKGGKHLITIEVVRRIRMPYNIDKEFVNETE